MSARCLPPRCVMLVAGVLLALTAIRNGEVLADEKSAPPKVGETAPDFQLKTLQGETVQLSSLTRQGPVVLLVLRGYPGYQCPICNAQVGDFLKRAKDFAEADAQVVLVYPGPADGLKRHADDFISGQSLPERFHFVIDPEYRFTNAWHLRWDAPRETAYPSTFIIDRQNTIRFAHVSKTHGGRTKAAEILKELPEA